MQKRISSLSLALTLGLALSAPAFSAEPAASRGEGVSLSDAKAKKTSVGASLEGWLKDLRKRVARTRARQNQVVAVAAVRGAEAEDAPPLYWKGKKSKGPVEEKELGAFEKAVEAAIAGQPDADQQLKDFIAAYPKSSLAGDAQSALDRIQVASAEP